MVEIQELYTELKFKQSMEPGLYKKKEDGDNTVHRSWEERQKIIKGKRKAAQDRNNYNMLKHIIILLKHFPIKIYSNFFIKFFCHCRC